MIHRFVIEPLGREHNREEFYCGFEALDRYIRHQAGQDVRRRANACFVARDVATGRLAGYYTLSASSIPIEELPVSLAKRFPRYPLVGVARLGRLAVSVEFRGLQLGSALLWDAYARSARGDVVVFALAVDAKDETAQRFYLHHGFLPLQSKPRTLLLPLKSPTAR
jgi:ribosomal protein S18 acetylase RimI-like enzyme